MCYVFIWKECLKHFSVLISNTTKIHRYNPKQKLSGVLNFKNIHKSSELGLQTKNFENHCSILSNSSFILSQTHSGWEFPPLCITTNPACEHHAFATARPSRQSSVLASLNLLAHRLRLTDPSYLSFTWLPGRHNQVSSLSVRFPSPQPQCWMAHSSVSL